MSHFITVNVVGVSDYADESKDGRAIKLGIDSIHQIVDALNEKLKGGTVMLQCIIAVGTVKKSSDPYSHVPEDEKLAALTKFKQGMLDKALREEGRCDCAMCQASWQVLDALDQDEMDLHQAFAAVCGLHDQIEKKLDAQVAWSPSWQGRMN